MRFPLQQYRRTHHTPAMALSDLRSRITRQGPLDIHAIHAISAQSGVPLGALRGAISFYDDLRIRADTIRVCRGTSCQLNGAADFAETLAGDAPCESVYCLGYCDRSPAAMLADGTVVAAEDADRRTSVRCTAGEPIVTHRLLQGDCSAITAARRASVYEALEMALACSPRRLLDTMRASGERGRGGAGFSTGAKWRACAEAPGEIKYVIANGDEGDPGSFIDRLLMEYDPHAMIEGMVICARAVGAHEGIIFIRSEYPRAIKAVARALKDAEAEGLIGPDVMGSGFAFDIRIAEGLGSYVCGEETAMLNAIEGSRGEVRIRPPFPAAAGLHGRPTVVNNVETLVNIRWIIANGAEAYASLGTAASSGTKAICLNRGFARPGVVEVEFGRSLRQVIEEDGGGGRDGATIEAVLLGGPMGSVLTPDEWDLPICYEAMARRGVSLGHGGLVAVTDRHDLSRLILDGLRFMQHESCGKCVPCRIGSRLALEAAERMVAGDAGARESLCRLLDVIHDGSLCAFGELTPGPIRRLMTLAADRVAARGAS